MPTYHIRCDNCTHVIEFTPPAKVAKQHLSAGLVRALGKFAEAVYRKGENSVHLTKDMPAEFGLKLTHTEHANFQKLRYWGLVHKPNKEQKGKYVAHDGVWLLTHLGSMFLNGTKKIRRTRKTSDNKVVGEDGPLVGIENYRGKIPEFQQIFEYYVIDGVPKPLKIDQARLPI